MFAPKWKKEAKLLDKAAKKFLNYKRDLLDARQIAEIDSRRHDVNKARKAGNQEQCNEASKQLQATCEGALPRQPSQGWVEENLEVLFVAIVIALGLRAYVVQPFRIPTGSMQPTLNGIVATSVESADEFPSFVVRQLQQASHGRSYVNLVLKENKRLRQKNPIIESQFLHFFTRTYIHFADGSKMTFPGPKAALMNRNGMGFGRICGYPTRDMSQAEQQQYRIDMQSTPPSDMSFEGSGKRQTAMIRPELAADTVIARGYIDTGDLILVDKMSYHFRRPSRGEVFVFDTRDIKKIHSSAASNGSAAGSHYIKRLAGVPGDKLQIHGLDLHINGAKAKEPGIAKVMSLKNGHHGYEPTYRLAGGQTFKARESSIPGMNEYIALGDNSFNSSDSRFWGTVKEFNVIGPAAFTLWPFSSGHWGVIK
ncbi:MAG: signal peptidase I [Verrucomicrobiae bacterium]|nr:signal peptidase I [Verrucomicrobiae bacterium]NNJ43387.1 signal peptidase I [Akkermansiaceae bacterium]